MLPTPEWSFKARNVLQVVLLALKGSMDKKKTNVQFSNVHKLQLCSLRLAELKLTSKGGRGGVRLVFFFLFKYLRHAR